jgi:hypothetical protein
VTNDVEDADELVVFLNGIRSRCRDRNRARRFEFRRLHLQQLLLSVPFTPEIKITGIGASGRQIIIYEDSLVSCFGGPDGLLADRISGINHNLISGGLLIEYGDARIVLGGDIEEDAWQDNLAQLPSLRSQLVKVSHHGSKTGYCDGLWSALSPGKSAIAVIAPYTKYGLPSEEGLGHIAAHANIIFTSSVEAAVQDRHQRHASVARDLASLPLDVSAALVATFPTIRRVGDRAEGCCSFEVFADGVVNQQTSGAAGTLRR